MRFLILMLLLLCIKVFANAEVEIHKTKPIEACVLGKPDTQIVRVCIDNVRYGIQYESGVGYGWYIQKMFTDDTNPASKCSCESFAAERAKQSAKEVEQQKKIEKLQRKINSFTNIECVKC